MTPDERLALQHGGDLYALGVKPSPIDLKDYVFAPPKPGALATFTHKAARQVPVRNQQGGTCVGNSISTVMQYLEFEETNKVIPFNGELINARVVGRDYGQGAAMYAKDGLEDVRLHGALSDVGDQGFTLYFPAGYALVDHTDPEAVKQAISTPGVVVTFAVWLISTFDNHADSHGQLVTYDGKTYIQDVPGENPYALHEITACGYTDQGAIFQNSWGDGYGYGGFGRLTWDYLAKRGQEAWAVTNASDTVKEGMVKVYTPPTEPSRGRAVRKAGDPAVWLVLTGGRVWIQNRTMAAQMGVDLTKVVNLLPTDAVWNMPVTGPEPR